MVTTEQGKRLKKWASEALAELRREGLIDASFVPGLPEITLRSTESLEIFTIDIEYADNTEPPIKVKFVKPSDRDVRTFAIEEIKRQIVVWLGRAP